ncbi:MAG: hypothetical protein IT580_10060, partial [Verrucomicrobiales bacterium]|nr:hypothetical protein [Verrucomicrobiales bacterium]
PGVRTLIQSGVPNQGTGSTLNFLLNSFGLKSTTRLLGRVLDLAWDKVVAGGTIAGPTSAFDLDLSDLGGATEAERKLDFIGKYVGTFRDLLASYAFLDSDGDGTLETLTVSGPEESGTPLTPDHFLPAGNGLLADLNSGPGGTTGFANVPVKTRVVYSDGVAETPDGLAREEGFTLARRLQNERLRFSDLIGRLPGSSEIWYANENAPGGGDGTVSAFSASDGFTPDKLIRITAADAGVTEPIDHSGLVLNVYSQRRILAEILGASSYLDIPVGQVSTSLALNKIQAGLNVLGRGLVDPVEYAKEAFQRLRELVSDLKSTAGGALDFELPLIEKSLSQLLFNSSNPVEGIGLNFFDEFEAGVANLASQLTLTNLESAIEGGLGLSPTQFELTLAGTVLTIRFNFQLSKQLAYTLDLNNTGVPVSGSIPLTLDLKLETQFAVVIDFGEFIANPKAAIGGDGLGLALEKFEIGATLSASDINVAVEFGGLGAFAINGGAASVSGLLNVALTDPDGVLTVGDWLTAESFGSLIAFNPSIPLSFVLPATLSIDTEVLDFAGQGTLRFASPDLLSGELPEVGVSGSVTTLSLLGFVSGAADFSIQGRPVDVDADGDSAFDPLAGDLEAAHLVSYAFSINQPGQGLVVGVDGTGVALNAGALAVATLTPASATDTRRYLAARADEVGGTLSIPGVSGSISHLDVRVNRAETPTGTVRALDWSQDLDLDREGAFGDALNPGEELPGAPDLTLDLATEQIRASGSLTGLDLFGVLSGSADFAIGMDRVDVEVDGISGFAPGIGSGDLEAASLLTMALSIPTAGPGLRFGVNGAGLHVASGSVAIALVTPADSVADPRRFVALRADDVGVTLTVPGISGSVSGVSLAWNSGRDATGSIPPLNWSEAIDLDSDASFGDVVDPGQDLPTPVALPIALDRAVLKASGTLTNLDLFGVLTGSAGFALSMAPVDLDLDG